MARSTPLTAALLGIALLAAPAATPVSAMTHTPVGAAVHEAGVKVKTFSHHGFGRHRGGVGIKKFGFNRFGGKTVLVAPKRHRRFGHGPTVKKFFSPFSRGIIVIK